MVRFTKTLLFIALFAAFTAALSSMNVPAVDGEQHGLLTEITVSASLGTGKISVEISPLINTDTQQSIKTAAQLAARLANKSLSAYDFRVSIHTDASAVDGSSGGAAMTLLFYAELSSRRVRSDATITATVEDDGSLGGVGGVKEKLDAAISHNITLVVISKGQSAFDDFDYVEYGREKSSGKTQVAEAATAEEAVKLLFTQIGTRLSLPQSAISPLSVRKITPSPALAPLRQIAQEELDSLNRTYAELLANLEKRGINLTAEAGSEVAATAFERGIKKSVSNAQLLLDNGYYYSAANAAFLTEINLRSIDLHNVSKTEFEALLDELWNKIESSNFTPKTTKNIEWATAAELRFYWAKWKLDSIEQSLESGTPVASLITEYASAKSWFDASEKMDLLARQVDGGKTVTELNARNHARRLLDSIIERIKASERLAQDAEIQWHLEAAQEECASAAYVACATDAGFAIAYANVFDESANKTLRQLSRGLENETALPNYAASPWAQAYFIHGIFNAQEYNRTGAAAYLQNALKLQSLADQLLGNTRQLEIELVLPTPFEPIVRESNETNANASANETNQTIPPAPLVTVTSLQKTGQPNWLNLLFAGAAFLVAILLFSLFLSKITSRRSSAPLKPEEALEKLDRALIEGRITERTYERLRGKYEQKTIPQSQANQKLVQSLEETPRKARKKTAKKPQ